MPISLDGLSKRKKKPMNIKWELNEPFALPFVERGGKIESRINSLPLFL